MTADRIAQLLVAEAKQGRSAVRLTWGDPLLFGWGDVEGAAVARHGVAIEVVPGIGPLIAIGAFAGIPLTRSSDASPSVAAVSVTRGHETLHDWDKLATATDTLAIVCDAESIAETARSLVFYGRSPTDTRRDRRGGLAAVAAHHRDDARHGPAAAAVTNGRASCSSSASARRR